MTVKSFATEGYYILLQEMFFVSEKKTRLFSIVWNVEIELDPIFLQLKSIWKSSRTFLELSSAKNSSVLAYLWTPMNA